MTQSKNTGTTDLSKRTPEEIFTHHAQSLGAEDLDATVMDYSDAAYTSSRQKEQALVQGEKRCGFVMVL